MTMKTIITLIFACFPLLAFSQNKAIDDLFNKYAGKEGITTVDINGGLLQLAAAIDTGKHSNDLVKSLNHVRILTIDDKNSNQGINFYKEVIGGIPVQDYKELMTVKEKDQDVKFLAKESGGKITELLMIVGGSDNALIFITGNIDPKDLSDVEHMVRNKH